MPKDSSGRGLKWEDAFIQQMYPELWDTPAISSTQEDIYGHWDVNTPDLGKLDIKAPKNVKAYKDHPLNGKIFWAELQNVDGNKGSMEGDADHFALGIHDKTSIAFRRDLTLQLVRNSIRYPDRILPMPRDPYEVKYYTQYYRLREGSRLDDILVMLNIEDLKVVKTFPKLLI